MMGRIFGNLPFCFVYLEDILVFLNTLADYQIPLHHVLDLCRLHSLTINLEKCVFAASQVEYLDHSVSSSESAPLHKYISTITAFPPPTDHPALQGFLGKVNFYTKFIYGAALILHSLTDALHGDPKDLFWFPLCLGQVCLGTGAFPGAS